MDNVEVLARKYYPRMWNKARLVALVKAGKLSREAYQDIVGEPAPVMGGVDLLAADGGDYHVE